MGDRKLQEESYTILRFTKMSILIRGDFNSGFAFGVQILCGNFPISGNTGDFFSELSISIFELLCCLVPTQDTISVLYSYQHFPSLIVEAVRTQRSDTRGIR